MSENAISITTLNDFIFCPASIYFHGLDCDTDVMVYQNADQLNGTAVHTKVDDASYSTEVSVLQGVSVYSEKYDMFGKIDVFQIGTGVLRERKRKISVIYDGYVFQIYAQCFALREMGYMVKKLVLYSYADNKSYTIPLPEDDLAMTDKFEKLIFQIKNFSFENFVQENKEKCLRCIYEPLCAFSKVKEEYDYCT